MNNVLFVKLSSDLQWMRSFQIFRVSISDRISLVTVVSNSPATVVSNSHSPLS